MKEIVGILSERKERISKKLLKKWAKSNPEFRQFLRKEKKNEKKVT